jgi:nucleoside-diphosphate-sugar epimerase
MEIAILGGTRFIGPAIVRILVGQGHQVSVYHSGRTMGKLPDGVERVIIDRTKRGQTTAALRKHRPEAIIDMIGMESEQIAEIIDADIPLKHYVFCSSTAIYGKIGDATPKESFKPAPDNAYTTGKIACEELLLSAYRESGFPFTSLRLAHPYGPLDELIYNTGRESHFLDRMRNGRPILIPAEGETRIHAIYVDDAARAFVHVLCGDQHMGAIYNLAGEQIMTLNEYFESIARALKCPLVAEYIPVEWFEKNADFWEGHHRGFGFATAWYHYQSAFDISALKATGFDCLTDHDRGVAENVAWLDSEGMIPASSDDDMEDRIIKAARSRTG